MESMHEVQTRLVEFAEKMHREHRGETILAGTHNGLLKASFMVDTVKRYDLDAGYRKFEVKNCAVVVLEINDYDIRVVATNGLTYK